MTAQRLPEYWLRGPLENIPPLLQPVAHAMLQAREEVNHLMQQFPNERLYIKPAGMASVAFHLQHLAGVLDRLFTYARGEALTTDQMHALKSEGIQAEASVDSSLLVRRFNEQVEQCIEELQKADEASLTQQRFVGRARLPSTVMGLLFHAAEHTMRHVGQLLVTVQVVKAGAV